MEPTQWTDSDGLGPIIGGILCSVSKFPNENIPQKGQQTTITTTVQTSQTWLFNLNPVRPQNIPILAPLSSLLRL